MATMIARTSLPPAMEGLVEDVPLQNPNTLTHNRVYSKVGATRILQAEPAVLNFGGYSLGQVYSQKLLIRNVRASGTRFHIVPPSTPFFKATCGTKKGLLAPGMLEEVVVEFCPTQYRYYYDCVRIHAEEENLLVPIHAYPVANETLFPARVDFGRAAVGEEVVRRHTLECKVPVDFEFEIVEVRPHPAFRVEPTRGVVRGNGSVTVETSFCPLSLTTEEAVIEVRIAEFNSKPVTCVLTGSGWPGAARDRALAAALGDAAEGLQATLPGVAGRGTGRAGKEPKAGASPVLSMEELDGTALRRRAAPHLPVNKGGGVLRGGAGNGDAYTAYLDTARRTERIGQRDCRVDGPIRSRPPKLPPPPGEVPVDGVFVPGESLLLSAADVAYVLNQDPGRLRIKDVKGAIASRKEALAAQQAALQEALDGGAGAEGGAGGIHPLERPDIPPDVKGALFRMQLRAAEEAAKKVSLGTHPHTGEQLLSPQEVRRLQRQREAQQAQYRRSEELKATRRLQPEMEAAGAVHLPSATASDASFKPEWRLIEGSDWAKRTRVLDMFQRAVWRVITSLRLQRRLERIKELLAHLGYDKQRLAEEAANPVLLVTESDRPGTAPTKYLQPEMVRVRPLPLYRDVLFQVHEPVSTSHYTDFDELAPFQTKTPLEYRILGYTPEDFPGLTPYLPPLLDQPLLAGAAEEAAAAGEAVVPSGIVPAIAEYPPLPDACRNMPFITLELGSRYSDDKVFAAPEPSYGMDPDYMIQPRLYDMYDSMAHEAGASGGVRAMRGCPALSERWLVRQDTWAVQLGPEVVPELLSGPEAEDLPEDRPEDQDKPKICPRVPTDEELAKYLPTTSRAEALPPAAATTSTDAPSTSSPAAAGSGAAGAGSTDASSSSPAAPTRYRLVRDRHVSELDAAKDKGHLDSLAAFEQRLADYNALLKRPCYFALHL